MARITKLDKENASLIEYIDHFDHYPGLRCKICYNIYDSPESTIHHKGYNCVCKNCIRDMTDIFELSESDLEDIIINAGRDLAKGIEQ
jgi:hypothetical protein